jgi:ketosteroid isomerase-like protein
VNEAMVRDWVTAYVKAWASNSPGDIGMLFTDDALYRTAPHREPWRGRDGIIAGWLDHRDIPGAWTFRHELVAIAGDLAFVRGWTDYSDGDRFSNLWVIRLDEDGRCSEFTEWWMEIK